jgi:hypothetical protein
MLSGGSMDMRDAKVQANATGQRILMQAGTSINLGNVTPKAITATSAITTPIASSGVKIEAHTLLDLRAGAGINVAADAILGTLGDKSKLSLQASLLQISGALQAGYDSATNTVTGADASLSVNSRRGIVIGGSAVSLEAGPNYGQLVNAAAVLKASGSVTVKAATEANGFGLSLSARSAIFTEGANSQITISATGSLLLDGLVSAGGAGADATVSTGSVISIGQLVYAADQLTVTGGSHGRRADQRRRHSRHRFRRQHQSVGR